MGAEFTPDLTSFEGDKIGRKFCFDEPLLHPLRLGGLGMAEKRGSGQETNALAVELQNLSPRHLKMRICFHHYLKLYPNQSHRQPFSRDFWKSPEISLITMIRDRLHRLER
jgi:hypothetical protein